MLDIVDDAKQIQASKNHFAKEIHDEYLALAKEMQDKKISPEDVKRFIDILQRNKYCKQMFVQLLGIFYHI